MTPHSFAQSITGPETPNPSVAGDELPPVVEAHWRMHRAYDTEVTHESDVAGCRFVCGWCGGWGHKASNDGRPMTCRECNGLGWYVNG